MSIGDVKCPICGTWNPMQPHFCAGSVPSSNLPNGFNEERAYYLSENARFAAELASERRRGDDLSKRASEFYEQRNALLAVLKDAQDSIARYIGYIPERRYAIGRTLEAIDAAIRRATDLRSESP